MSLFDGLPEPVAEGMLILSQMNLTRYLDSILKRKSVDDVSDTEIPAAKRPLIGSQGLL